MSKNVRSKMTNNSQLFYQGPKLKVLENQLKQNQPHKVIRSNAWLEILCNQDQPYFSDLLSGWGI